MYRVVIVCSSVAIQWRLLAPYKFSQRIVETWPPIGNPSSHVQEANLYLSKPKKWRRRKKNLPTGASPPHVRVEISPGSRISIHLFSLSSCNSLSTVSPLLFFFCLHLETIGWGERPHKVQDFGLPPQPSVISLPSLQYRNLLRVQRWG